MNEHARTIIVAAISAAVGSALTVVLAGPFLVEKRLMKAELEMQGLAKSISRIEARLDGQIDRLKQNYESIDSRVTALQDVRWTGDDTKALLDELGVIQQKYVRESWGEYRGQNFTDEDYKAFVDGKNVDSAVADFAVSERFKKLLPKIRSLARDDWREVLSRIQKQYHPTWSDLGKIDRSGQTEAGQRAEKDIAIAVGEFLEKQRTQNG